MNKGTTVTNTPLTSMQMLADVNPDPALVCDPLGRIICANRGAVGLLGVESDEEFHGQRLDAFVSDLSRFDMRGGLLTAVRIGDMDRDVHVRRHDGEELLVWFSTSRIKTKEDEMYFILLTMRDVTERKRMEEELWALSFTDTLTGLHNRRFLEMMVPLEEERSKRYGQFLAVTFLDVDDFKEINDRHGHAVGDEVLKALSATLLESARTVDVLCRWGGDEFVLLSLVKSVDDVKLIGDRMARRASELAVRAGTEELKVKVSCGAAVGICSKELPASSLLERADELMLAAKRDGKGRSTVVHLP